MSQSRLPTWEELDAEHLKGIHECQQLNASLLSLISLIHPDDIETLSAKLDALESIQRSQKRLRRTEKQILAEQRFRNLD